MDSEFIKLLSEMAENEPENSNRTVSQLEHYLYEEQLRQHYEQDIKSPTVNARMPAYLKEQIITHRELLDMQTVTTPKRLSKRMELFLYSCKVTTAVAASLVLMFTASVTQNHLNAIPQDSSMIQKQNINIGGNIIKHLNSGSQTVTNWLQDFSGGLFEQKE